MQLRPYQTAALEAIYDYFARANGHPCISVGTGLGKSIICAEFCRWALEHDAEVRILVVVPTKELCQQNYDEMMLLWPEAPAGIYCAGLGRKENMQITFGTVQSLYKAESKILPPTLIICDEAHYLKATDEGMWRTIISRAELDNPDLRIVGMSATPWRMKEGRLDENGLFDEIVYEYGLKEGIRDGWLSPLVTKETDAFLDTTSVAIRGGEFVERDLQLAVDVEAVNREIIYETLKRAGNRKKWLVFCTGINHSNNIAALLRENNVFAQALTSEDCAEGRKAKIDAFKSGEITALCSANLLTTGFNVPAVDAIIFIRPTRSSGLLLQMAGRGSRKAKGKENCLILDFARNLERLGPLDLLDGKTKPRPKGSGDAPTRTCLECKTINHAAAVYCVECGHAFPLKQQFFKEVSTSPIFSDEIQEIPVTHVTYQIYKKDGKPDSLCITYHSGIATFKEWKHFELPGDIRRMTERWWRARINVPCPANARVAMQYKETLAKPEKIMVKRNGKYFNVVGYKWKHPELA